MDAYKFDRPLRIERATTTRNEIGEPIASWELVANTLAEKDPKLGREAFVAQQVIATGDVVYRIRWRSDIKPNRDEILRVIEDGITYGVQSILEVGRRQALDLLASRPE